MPKYQKWVLTLGILAATPGVTAAGPLSIFKYDKPDKASTERSAGPAEKSRNQQMAERVAQALRQANFQGYDIEIEYDKGVAKLMGKIDDPQQKARASRIVASIPGVNRVDNQLKSTGADAESRSRRVPQMRKPRTSHFRTVGASRGLPRHAGAERSEKTDSSSNKPFSVIRRNSASRTKPQSQQQKSSNQAVAEKIAKALQTARLNDFDIEIRYKNGRALLRGAVATSEQKNEATRLVRQVAGVKALDNRLQIRGKAAQSSAAGGAIRPVAAQRAMAAAYQQGGGQPMPPQGPAATRGGSGIPAPPSYGHPGQGASHVAYNMPHLPEHAWPSYASYPNYAQVSYPKQYSASAWPYIGPFYPYPQVPLGWRQAQLVWDDGYWNLKFDSKTDRWWWFLNPKHW